MCRCLGVAYRPAAGSHVHQRRAAAAAMKMMLSS